MRAHFILIASCLFTAGAMTPARAHLGHVGELAGHSHWIAVGAAVAAVALAALIAKGRKDEAEAEESEDAKSEAGGDTAGVEG